MTDGMTDDELVRFLYEHYSMRAAGFRCKRCGMEGITWPTKHAAERHGDDVAAPDLPDFNGELRW